MSESSCASSCCSCAPPSENAENQASPLRQNLGVLACGALALGGWVASHFSLDVARVLYAVAIAAGSWPLLRGSWAALRARSLDMNILMSVAVAGACVLGDWGEAASLVFLYAVSEWIEEWSVGRSRRAIGQLMNLAPPRALVQRDGQWRDVNAEEIAVGEVFLVRAGERLAFDGVVQSGESDVDQAPVTGESTPVFKSENDEVFAGTLNGSGALEVRATRLAHEGTVARIAQLVKQAKSERSPRQRFVERFARRYTPAVMLIAIAVAIVPPLLFHSDWHSAVFRALALLVAACPCAFVFSGPVATICAVSAAARNGVLIRGGAALETLAEVRIIAWDKSGTLTRGVAQVTDFAVVNGMPQARALQIAAALEQCSDHPLARAVVAFASESAQGENEQASNVEETSGRGVRGSVGGTDYRLGRVAVFAREGILNGRAERIVESLQNNGRSVSLLCDDAAPLAAIGFADEVRPEAASAFAQLKKLGITKCAILSGDHATVVKSVAAQVGADEWHASLLPEEKLNLIREMSRGDAASLGANSRRATAMVGDGINDAPALAAADLGIAMGAAGSDAALEVAGVALMGDDLQKLPQAIILARRARSVMRQNIALALTMKLVFAIGLFFGAWGNYALIGGVIADVGATLLVTANGLRLLRQSTP